LLCGPDFCETKRTNKRARGAGADARSTRYFTSSTWRARHLALFKLSYYFLADKVDDDFATRHGLNVLPIVVPANTYVNRN